MSLDAKGDFIFFGLFDAPSQFGAGAAPGVSRSFPVKIHAWQRGDVPGAGSLGVVQRAGKPITSAAAAGCFGMVYGKGNKIRGHLQEDIGATQAAVTQLSTKPCPCASRLFELARRP